MSRSVSDTFKEEVFKQATDEVFIMLVEIDHDDLSTPIRVNSSGADVVSNSNTFVGYPFDLTLPSDPETGVCVGSITVDNIAQDIIEAIRSITSPPTVTIQVVLGSDPDTVEIEFTDFNLYNVQYDQITITGNISMESFMSEPYPGDMFLPSTFPGCF